MRVARGRNDSARGRSRGLELGRECDRFRRMRSGVVEQSRPERNRVRDTDLAGILWDAHDGFARAVVALHLWSVAAELGSALCAIEHLDLTTTASRRAGAPQEGPIR